MNKIYARIILNTGMKLEGPWTLKNMFDLVACPVFENRAGDIVPMSFVWKAEKA